MIGNFMQIKFITLLVMSTTIFLNLFGVENIIIIKDDYDITDDRRIEGSFINTKLYGLADESHDSNGYHGDNVISAKIYWVFN